MSFREYLNEDETFNYKMLSRLQADCEYFLGAGKGSERNLWAGNVPDQIKEMKRLFNIIKEKPEWLSLKDIKKYERDMKKKLK